jgi:hypothetical protein
LFGGRKPADGVINDRRQIERYGTVIRNEGRRLSEMVEHALEFAGIESGQRHIIFARLMSKA